MRRTTLRRAAWVAAISLAVSGLGACTAMLPTPPATSAPASAGAGTPTRTAGFVPFVGGRYDGELRGGRPHGRGTFVAADRTTYRGEFADGRFHGQGRQDFPDGRVVEGRWDNDRAAAAALTYPDGRRFVGEITRGIPSGPGTLTLVDGTAQTGRFREGVLQGNGLQLTRDGRAYSGPFVNGQPHGEGLCAGGGAWGVCDRRNGQDFTERHLNERAAAGARQQVESEAKARVDDIDRMLKPGVDARQAELRNLSARQSRLGGPQQGDRCYCVLTRQCITVGNANASAAERARAEVQARQLRLECSSQYAEYLGYRDRGDLQQELARLQAAVGEARAQYEAAEGERRRRLQEIEDAKRRQLADQAAMRARADAERRRLEEERERRADEKRRRCADPAQQRATPCACAAALGTFAQYKGTVCEA